MKKSLHSHFTSISVKLFVCFWLIAFTSILATQLISKSLLQETRSIPYHKGDQRKLANISNRIIKKNYKQTTTFFLDLPKHIQDNVILKHLASNEILHGPKMHMNPRLLKYLSKNSFGKPHSLLFYNLRMTGPSLIKINGQSYQLFMVSPDKNFIWGVYLKQLPTWLLILIPVFTSVILCWLLARSLTRPLLDIQKISTELGNGNLSQRVEDACKRNDELGDLANSFNLMAGKLEQNIEAHQRLLADVSHELRSPLTRMQIAIGLAQNSHDDKVKLTKHLSRCETEIQRLDSMISEVLALSRLENTFPSLNILPIELSLCLEEIVQDSQYIANEKAIKISLNTPQKINLSCDKQLIVSAISNVVNNAIKYSPPQSQVTIKVQLMGDRVEIAISDQGDGVPEAELTQLFQAFYRVDLARDRESGGTGLGLAIAKQAILAHQGRINASNNQEGGLTVTVELPVNMKHS